MENNEKKIHIMDIVLFIVFLLLLAFPAYLCYQVLVTNNKPQEQGDNNTPDQDTTTQETTPEEVVVDNGPHYTESFEKISGQMAYIAVPTKIDTSNPPAIILYSHGSNTRVTSDTTNSFIKDLQKYGELFANNNFIFAASNEHDENWGNTASISDMLNLQQWIEQRYTTSTKLYLIGFSMGGLPTMHFTSKYPEDIVKIALLAPTTRTYEWTKTEVAKIKDIDIKIWHGTSDVNIGISSSRNFVKYMKNLGKEIALVELPMKTHFDVDAEYMDEILTFFQAEL